MKPYTYQEQISSDALEILREEGLAYLSMEERTGKTLTAILVAEKSLAENVLVVTKKKALEGWEETFRAFNTTKNYCLMNYHKVAKFAHSKYDLVILDEAHNYISAFPKAGKLWKDLKPVCRGKPILYMSATPYAQGPQMLYHQFALSSWSPWKKHTNFYRWFELYGLPYTKPIYGRDVKQYDRCDKELVLSTVEHLFITKTRAELGFAHEPEDKVHYIQLGETVRKLYNTLLQDELAILDIGDLVCDSASKLRTSLHQLEGGTIKLNDKGYSLDNCEKIEYILDNFGDNEGLVIMYNFIQERVKLEEFFKNATILQATSYAEGVDLHKFDNLVIYSQDYSTARHTQRRARQCNKKRDRPITVHYLLVKKAISEQVYKTVSVNKKNYVDSVFQRSVL